MSRVRLAKGLSLCESSQRRVLLFIERAKLISAEELKKRLLEWVHGRKDRAFFLAPGLSLEEFLRVEALRMELQSVQRGGGVKYCITPLGQKRLRSPKEATFLS